MKNSYMLSVETSTYERQSHVSAMLDRLINERTTFIKLSYEKNQSHMENIASIKKLIDLLRLKTVVNRKPKRLRAIEGIASETDVRAHEVQMRLSNIRYSNFCRDLQKALDESYVKGNLQKKGIVKNNEAEQRMYYEQSMHDSQAALTKYQDQVNFYDLRIVGYKSELKYLNKQLAELNKVNAQYSSPVTALRFMSNKRPKSSDHKARLPNISNKS